MGAVVRVNAYGLLPVGVVFLAILVLSLTEFGIVTMLVPLGMLVGSAFFLPLALGNTYVTRLARSVAAGTGRKENGLVVQLTLSPRVWSGLRAILEDADDIGWLTFERDGLRFEGDSVKLSVPYERVEAIKPENIGLRGAFVYGGRIKVAVSGLPASNWLEFAERGSRSLPASKRITRELYARLSASVGGGTKAGSSRAPQE